MLGPHPIIVTAVSIIVVFAASIETTAREIHVAKTGDDTASGDCDSPYLTVNDASQVAEPGDMVVVHAGVYRESIHPARGGNDEKSRIVYKAADGEEVTIKGSERIDTWTREPSGVWSVDLPNEYFGDYNPYALKLSGPWLNYGKWHHRGEVYLDGRALAEKEMPPEVEATERSWHCQVDETTTTIRANFGSVDPNRTLTEINVRENLFMPTVTGLSYITVDGIAFYHAAPNWAPPTIELQPGAVGPRMGRAWIIQNCTVCDSRCVGIILGQSPGTDYDDIDAFGSHVVRSNVIRRCGQAGIAGQKGATRSVVSGNLIEDTNYKKEFGGWETAAIKFHQSVDATVSNNLIRGVYHQQQGAFGIWMDFGNQGTRLSGNLIYNTQAAAIFLEMNHGPALVDNNIVIGGGFRSNSENTVFAHNLLVDYDWAYSNDLGRQSRYYRPHTRILVGKKTGVPANDHWYNNLFVRRGLDKVKSREGFVSEDNVFLENAKPSTFGDKRSRVLEVKTGFAIEESPRGATVRFAVGDDLPLLAETKWVDAERVGVFPTVEQTIEDRDGRPIRVDIDFHGKKRKVPTVGPIRVLKPGVNEICWQLGE